MVNLITTLLRLKIPSPPHEFITIYIYYISVDLIHQSESKTYINLIHIFVHQKFFKLLFKTGFGEQNYSLNLCSYDNSQRFFFVVIKTDVKCSH